MRVVIANPTVPLDLAGEVYIAGENQIFEHGFLSDATTASLSFLGQKIHRVNALIIAPIIEFIWCVLTVLNPPFTARH